MAPINILVVDDERSFVEPDMQENLFMNDVREDRRFEPARVECYSGYKVNERPTAFTFQGRRWEISEILDRWYEGGINSDAPIIDYFKVKAASETHENIFILRYAADADNWAVLIRNPT